VVVLRAPDPLAVSKGDDEDENEGRALQLDDGTVDVVVMKAAALREVTDTFSSALRAAIETENTTAKEVEKIESILSMAAFNLQMAYQEESATKKNLTLLGHAELLDFLSGAAYLARR